MRNDWILGFGAASTLVLLVGLDLLLTSIADRSHAATVLMLRELRESRRRR
jgi:hypothetical protein